MSSTNKTNKKIDNQPTNQQKLMTPEDVLMEIEFSSKLICPAPFLVICFSNFGFD